MYICGLLVAQWNYMTFGMISGVHDKNKETTLTIFGLLLVSYR